MSLRNQPYIPLYIQDFLTDEKLAECSASSTGVYIRLMCLMHKSEEYGKILLKQKDKQTPNHIKNFALKVAKQMPYSIDVVESALIELVDEKVINIDGDFLAQKRMIKDSSISEKRAQAGKNGGEKTQSKNKDFAKAKGEAPPENENENINEDESINEAAILPKMLQIFKSRISGYPVDTETDMQALRRISTFICKQSGLSFQPQIPETYETILSTWRIITNFIAGDTGDNFYTDFSLKQINSNIQTIVQKVKNGSANSKKPNGPAKITSAALNEVFTQRRNKGAA